MSAKVLGGIVVAVLAVVLCCGLFGTVVVGSVAGACTAATAPSAVLLATISSSESTRLKDFDAEQVGNAETIVSVGAHLGVPERGWVIAVAAAMRESNLGNLSGGDQDSVGLFQQRASQGWGTVEQLRDPTYAATEFYQKLLTVSGWQNMPLAQAAQAVQGSATPEAYARYEASAATMVSAVASARGLATPRDVGACGDSCPAAASVDGQSSPDPGCLEGDAILARAAGWLTGWSGGPVPYSSSSDPTTWFDGYRRDCSGYASMALGLPGPGLDTGGLAARSTPIQKADLRAGDLLINPAPGNAGHVVIFDRWTDQTMTSYIGYEQSGDGGTHHRVISYPYFGGDQQFSPYRFLG